MFSGRNVLTHRTGSASSLRSRTHCSAHKQAESRASCHRNVYKSRPEECKQSRVELLSDKRVNFRQSCCGLPVWSLHCRRSLSIGAQSFAPTSASVPELARGGSRVQCLAQRHVGGGCSGRGKCYSSALDFPAEIHSNDV